MSENEKPEEEKPLTVRDFAEDVDTPLELYFQYYIRKAMNKCFEIDSKVGITRNIDYSSFSGKANTTEVADKAITQYRTEACEEIAREMAEGLQKEEEIRKIIKQVKKPRGKLFRLFSRT